MPKTALQEAYDQTGVLRYEEAMRYLEDEHLISISLKEFYEEITETADAIENFLKAEDYDNYTIKVHALKSSARIIGASDLSEKARILEEMGNRILAKEYES